MATIKNALVNMGFLDDLAMKESFIHNIHPLIKLLTTVLYLTVVVSFGKGDFSQLFPYFLYPVLIFSLADIPVVPILKRMVLVAPLIIGIGILNPIFEEETILLFGITLSVGWVTFFSLLLKGALTVMVSLLLIATTGMNQLGAALRMLKVPKIFVLQLLLTYRYISVLIEELLRMVRAYSLRAPGQKGIHPRVWGSFVGQLLLRTYERGQRVYQSMNARGFSGEYYSGNHAKIKGKDIAYFLCWSLFFLLARFYDIPLFIETLIFSMGGE